MTRRTPFVLITAVLALSGCVHLRTAEHPREPEPVDEGLLAALRPRHPALRFQLDFVERTAAWDRYVLRFQTYSETSGDYKVVEGDYYASRKARGEPAPLILISPILAGPVDDYLASRFVAGRACRAGMSAFFLHQEKIILDPDRDAPALEARMRETIRDNIKALDVLARLPEIDASRLGSIGVSLGAIRSVVLIACEPRLRANALALAGADLADMLIGSRENLVERYLRGRRRRDGLVAEEVASEFRRWLRSDPARLAGSVETDRVLLILGRFDDKVPYRNGLLLRRLLGDPATRIVPLGHYTGIVAAPWMVQVALGWIRERLGRG